MGMFRCAVLDHFRIQHTRGHFVKREALGIGFFVVHPQRDDEADDHLLPAIENINLALAMHVLHERPPKYIKVFKKLQIP